MNWFALTTKFLPQVVRSREAIKILFRQKHKYDNFSDTEKEYVELAMQLILAWEHETVVFDCRELDIGFVRETGEAAIAENEQQQIHFRLPYNCCYFEFDGAYGIKAFEHEEPDNDTEVGEGASKVVGNSLKFYVATPNIDGYLSDNFGLLGASMEIPYQLLLGPTDTGESVGVTLNLAGVTTLDNPSIPHDTKNMIIGAASILVGVLTLLDEKFVSSEFKPAETKINKARAKNGKPPLSVEHRVLTINKAAVRAAVAVSDPEHTHSQKRLHWRRGHWRTYSTGDKTWVRRCLAGNPELGVIHKDYRLTWGKECHSTNQTSELGSRKLG